MKRKEVRWMNRFGSTCYFSEGFNPNLVDPDASWINEAKENKMTRDEAIKKISIKCANTMTTAHVIVDSLEALGLIKFEEKKSSLQIIHSNLDFYEGSMQQAMKIEKELKEAGYLK